MKSAYFNKLIQSVDKDYLRLLLILSITLVFNSLSPWLPVIGAFIATLLTRNFKLSGSASFLLVLWLVYDFLGLSNGNTSVQMAIYLTLPSILFFYLGNEFVRRARSAYNVYLTIFVMITSLALPHILVTIYDIYEVGLVNPDRFLAILGEDNQRSITQRTIEISLCIGSIGLLFQNTTDKTSKRLNRLMVIVSVLAFLCALHYVSRTGVVICLVSLSVGVLYNWGISFKTIFFVGVALIFYTWLQGTELFDVYAQRETDYSNISNAGLRMPRWEWAWNTTFENPLGTVGFLKAEHPYAHNFWLDLGKNCGVLPFFMMILFSLNHLRNIIKLVRCRIPLLSFAFTLWTLTCYMSLFTEPIHEGATLFMFIYFFYCGVTEQIVNGNK